jgi:hypothetical protein
MLSHTTSNIGAFLREEVRGLGRAFWRLFWKATLIVTVLMTIAGLIGSRGASTASAQDSLFIQIIAYVAVGLYFGAFAGAAVGLFAALWRLFGASLMVVLVIAPVLVVLVLWLFHEPVAASAIHFLENVAASAGREGLQQTVQAAEGMRLSCGGGAIGVLFLVLISPWLLADIGLILADAGVLWSFLKFAGTMALMLVAATSTAFLFACPVLVFALIRRGRRRFGELPPSL